MSEEELDLSYELLELISAKVGADNLRNFLRDFADYCNAILPDESDDEDYVEVIDSQSEDSEVDEDEDEVDEEYTTEVDEEGFYSLKECEVDNQK